MFFWAIIYIVVLAFIHAAVVVFCDFKMASLKKKGVSPEKIAKYDLKAKRREALYDFQDLFPFTKPIFALFSKRLIKRKEK